MKCSVYIAASVDGFIARPDGDIDWLLRPEYSVALVPGLRYDDFIATVDALVMGRNSFEKVLTFDGWPYEGTPVVVLTSRDLDVPAHLAGKVRTASGDPVAIVEQLAAEGMQHLYIDGGATIQRFLQAGLIGTLTITYIPLLLGDGIPLFGVIGTEIPLRLVSATSAENGFVQVTYDVASND